MARPVHAVDQQNVLPPVGVVVEERTAGTQCFRQQLAAVAAGVVTEGDTGRRGDVGELEWQLGGGAVADRSPLPGAGSQAGEKRPPVHNGFTRPFCSA